MADPEPPDNSSPPITNGAHREHDVQSSAGDLPRRSGHALHGPSSLPNAFRTPNVNGPSADSSVPPSSDQNVSSDDPNDTTAPVSATGSQDNENRQTERPDSVSQKRKWADTSREVMRKKKGLKVFQPPEDENKLCAMCESLDLDFENFVIPSEKGPNFYGEKPIGTYSKIRDRASCPLCRLLIQSLGERFNPETDGNPSCNLLWTLDGRKQDKSRIVPVTRRLQIVWRRSSAEDLFRKTTEKSYIVLVAPHARFDARDSFEEDGAIRSKSTLFLGRLLTTVTSLVRDSSDLAKRWLNVCAANHGNKCSPAKTLSARAPHDLLRSPSFAVVDVNEMCLCALPRTGDVLPKYVAMSYTWGIEKPENKRFRCDNGNAHLLQQSQGIMFVMEGLPMAIQDAINLTRKLDIHYLWVDSLCITQDNDWSWVNNAAIMDVIYGNAALTICAADNDSEQYGLKALSQHEHESKYKRQAAEYWIEYRKTTGVKPIQLLLSHPSESYIARSRWDHRGWTFQERLLSPRCLIFVDGRMYFQCRSTTMSEDIYSDDVNAIAGWSVELHGAPAQLLDELSENPIKIFKELVEMYTSRDLTRENDILTAFKGITNLITESLGTRCEMIYGLPNSHFDWALLWSSDEQLLRRSGETAEHMLSKDFPSWSWCGWKGGEFNHSWHGGNITYKQSTIIGEETEFNLYKWLQIRTWITYYISNGQGRLRLIWDPKRHAPNEDVEDWRGYKKPRDFEVPSDDQIEQGIFPKYDLHGRAFNSDLPVKGRVTDAERHFVRRLPTSQLTVVVLEAGHDDTEDYKYAAIRPFNETYLQFFTWAAKFTLEESDAGKQVSRAGTLRPGLKRFFVIDKNGDFAGTCVLDEKFSVAAKKKIPQEFIALSYARKFAQAEYPYGGFYGGRYAESEWQLYNVMMLEYRSQKEDRYGIGYRAGIGKMYTGAFSNGWEPVGDSQLREWVYEKQGMYWKEIVLG